VYTHPGDDRPSPGTFTDLLQVINALDLTAANLVAVVVPFRDEIPFGGPHAVVFNGLADDNTRLGPMEFRTMAFRDMDFLIQILHAVGIHAIVDPEFQPVAAQSGPAAGEPDVPRRPAPVPPAPLPLDEPDPEQGALPLDQPGDEVIVAAPTT
jgi:hypothetical protein